MWRGRVGLFRTLLLEVSGPDADAELARDLALAEMISPLVDYVTGQMAQGRLRRTEPLVALQAFAGPLIMHLITRDIAERALASTPRWSGSRTYWQRAGCGRWPRATESR